MSNLSRRSNIRAGVFSGLLSLFPLWLRQSSSDVGARRLAGISALLIIFLSASCLVYGLLPAPIEPKRRKRFAVVGGLLITLAIAWVFQLV